MKIKLLKRDIVCAGTAHITAPGEADRWSEIIDKVNDGAAYATVERPFAV